MGSTNINTSGTAATAIGNNNAATTAVVTDGNSRLSLSQGTASLSSGTNSGFTSYSSKQIVGTAPITLTNGSVGSQYLVRNARINNAIKGNTLVDGDMYINGTFVYASNTSASTTVTGKSTTGNISLVNTGQAGAVVDRNGKISNNGPTTEATAAMTITNSQGNTHGFVVQESKSTMSGGYNSSSMILDDNGARFTNSASGAPVTVTGVADGRSDYDAVNVRQFGHAIAAVSATANIPAPAYGKAASVGIGLGHFMGNTALALGANYRVTENFTVKPSGATGVDGGSKPVFGAGVGWSW